jgi:hypothetical protein
LRFWDSSCLVSLLVEEGRSRSCRDLIRADREVWVWTFARVEVWGGLCRKRREGALSAEASLIARSQLDRVARRWQPVFDSAHVRAQAERVLDGHDLRTADALQLAAALVWCDGRPHGRQFVAADARLLAAASAEGFTTIQPG